MIKCYFGGFLHPAFGIKNILCRKVTKWNDFLGSYYGQIKGPSSGEYFTCSLETKKEKGIKTTTNWYFHNFRYGNLLLLWKHEL